MKYKTMVVSATDLEWALNDMADTGWTMVAQVVINGPFEPTILVTFVTGIG